MLVLCVVLYTGYALGQSIIPVRYAELEHRFQAGGDTTYVVNFFASWCAPCLLEIPAIKSFADQHLKDKIVTLFVSLDAGKDVWKQLTPVVKCYQLSKVFVLKDTDANQWINAVDSAWDGAIPATYMHKHSTGYHKLIAGPVTQSDLLQQVP